MSGLQHPPADDFRLAHVLEALGDPIRLEIVRQLHERGELSCTESIATFPIPKATLSRHYQMLRAAGLVHTRKQGVQYANRLRRAELDAKFPGLLGSVLAAAQPLTAWPEVRVEETPAATACAA